MKHVLQIFILSAALAAGCSVFKKKEDNKKSESGETTVESLSFTLPEKDAEGVVDYKDITEGEYKIAEILTSFEGVGEEKFKSLFKHTVATPGDPDKDDPVSYAADFSQLNLEEKIYHPAVEINLPLRIKKESGEVKFLDKHYYWNQNRSDGGWRWSLSGGPSPEGDKFHAALELAEKDGAMYTLSSGKVNTKIVAKQLDENTIQIFVENRREDLIISYRLTYTK